MSCTFNFYTGPAISLEKQNSLFIKTDSKISYGFGGNCNLSKLSGLCLFCTLNCMKTPFSDAFLELLFLYASSILPKFVLYCHHTNTHQLGVLNSPNQISSKWILNSKQDCCELEIHD